MYLGPDKSRALALQYAAMPVPAEVTAVVCPTALSFQEVGRLVNGSGWLTCAQNVAWTPEGAYTGAISAQFFQEVGASYALIGHSERRHIFGETDPDVRKKLEAVLTIGLKPILCIGETADDLAAGKRQYRLKKQLMTALQNLPEAARVLIAYEPVWAIHTATNDTPCLPADVADIHGWIAEEVKQYSIVDPVILYGGSVNAENASGYLELPLVHGLLVGTASLHPEEVKPILSLLSKA